MNPFRTTDGADVFVSKTHVRRSDRHTWLYPIEPAAGSVSDLSKRAFQACARLDAIEIVEYIGLVLFRFTGLRNDVDRRTCVVAIKEGRLPGIRFEFEDA